MKQIIYIGVIVSISNTASIITLALPKSDNNNNIYLYIQINITSESTIAIKTEPFTPE